MAADFRTLYYGGCNMLESIYMNTKTLPGPSVYAGNPVTEIMVNGFFTVDRKWKVTFWNKAAEKISGISATEITGRNLWEKFAGAIPIPFYQVYYQAFLRSSPVHYEKNWGDMGSWFDVITYHCDDTVSISFKSKSRQQLEYPPLQLKIMNDLYKFVTMITNGCIWEWDIENKLVFWIDGGHKKVFGFDIENALVPLSFCESLLHPDDKTRVIDGINKHILEKPGVLWEEEYRFQKANGDYVYVHDRGHLIYRDNKPSRMIGATQDISARKLTGVQLTESEKKLSLIAMQTVNAVIITDAHQKITWVNDAFTRFTEFSAPEVMGKKPWNFLHGKETDKPTIDYIRRKIKSRQPFDCTILNYSKSGRKYWVHIQGQALLDDQGNCERFFAIQTDITEKVLLEHKLAEERIAREKAVTEAVLTAQENERAEIGKELHDNVNQILGATKLYIEMAKEREPGNEVYLNQACSHLLNVIEEIRRISKTLIPQSMTLIGLAESIEILIDDLSRVHPLNIRFEQAGINDAAMGEKLQLNIFRIVQEQTNNILKHASATQALISLKRHKNKIVLMITDNGKGCNTGESKKGVGIRNILSRTELFKGILNIESKPGEGYKMKIELPLGQA